MKDLYSELGLSKNATDEEIKEAYKKRAKETHPDKQGGDTEKFQAVAHAYTILSDPAKRDRYDKTGETREASAKNMFMNYLNETLGMILKSPLSPKYGDIVEAVVKLTDSQIDEDEKQIKGLNILLEKAQEMKKRIHHNKEGDDLFTIVIDGNIRDIEKQMAITKERIKLFQGYIEILDNYDYVVDKTNELNSFSIQGW